MNESIKIINQSINHHQDGNNVSESVMSVLLELENGRRDAQMGAHFLTIVASLTFKRDQVGQSEPRRLKMWYLKERMNSFVVCKREFPIVNNQCQNAR